MGCRESIAGMEQYGVTMNPSQFVVDRLLTSDEPSIGPPLDLDGREAVNAHRAGWTLGGVLLGREAHNPRVRGARWAPVPRPKAKVRLANIPTLKSRVRWLTENLPARSELALVPPS
mmetsp:Transcript_5962/g.13466  ORF Transcript_5962/g.13466 Transcript_5962/m.13466 type:complete len:117 (+) Transcript_5962:644-994(+)